MNLVEFVINYPYATIIILPFAVVIITILTLLIVFLVIKGSNFSIGKEGLVIGDSSKKKSRHSYCKYVGEVVHVFRTRDDLRAKIDKIESYKMPRDVMRIAEHGFDRVRTELEKNYLSLLSTMDVFNQYELCQTQQYRLFKTMLDAMRPIILSECRRMMQENGWIQKEKNNTWDVYVEKHIDQFILRYENKLDELYIFSDPSRNEVHDWNRADIILIIKDHLRSTMNEMLKTAKFWETCINKLSNRMDEEFKKVVGDLDGC